MSINRFISFIGVIMLRYTTILLALLIMGNPIYSQKQNIDEQVLANVKIPPTDYLLDHATMGKDFYVAFPPNAMADGSLKYYGLDIIVTATRNTVVRAEMQDGFLITRQVEAYKPTLFSSSKKDYGTLVEIKESDQVTYKGIHISSEEPITVFVLSNRQYSAEGYVALPVSSWGTYYIHNAYWDFKDKPYAWGPEYPYGGGFVVVASEPNTRVTINLKGKGEGVAKTLGDVGHDIGESFNVTLNQGQTYMLCGNGLTKGVFDISGTTINASKPIGVISFHDRTMIPNQCPNDRDNLIEMITPTDTWGKYFVTVQYDRTPSGGNSGKGDFFRVMSKEANTTVSCKYYDIASGELMGNWPSSLKLEGSFAEFNQTTVQTTGNKATSIYGISVWESDKPIMVMQYAYSQPWDGDMKFSPLMVQISPVENFVRSAIFSTPISDFDENILTLIVIGDPNDPTRELLKSVYYNDEILIEKYPQILSSRVPGTDLYWIKIQLPSKGVYKIYSSKTKFWGYLTGFSSFNAYGWPIAMGCNLLDNQDFEPPQFEITQNCGNYAITVTEMNNSNNTDQGISHILMYDSSFNYKLELVNPEKFRPENKITSQKFNLTLIDPLKPAKAWFVASDRGGNIKRDSVDYEPEKLLFKTKLADLGKVLIGSKKDSSFSIINNGTKPINITKIQLTKGKVFTFNNVTLPYTIQPLDSLIVKYSYIPETETIGENKADIDTCFVSSDCIGYFVALSGKGIMPHITLQDMDFGNVIVGKKVCYEDLFKDGFSISNPGTAELTILEIKDVNPPFTITSPTEPALPFKIAPGAKRSVRSLCYVPKDTVFSEITIKVISDAKDDSTIIVRGTGIPEPGSVPEILIDESTISVIPNPIYSNNAEIRIDNSLNVNKIELFDMKGSVVQEIASGVISNPVKFNVFGLSSGVYYLKFSTSNKTLIKRIVIAN